MACPGAPEHLGDVGAGDDDAAAVLEPGVGDGERAGLAFHRLAGEGEVSFRQLAEETFVALPAHEGSVMGDRMRRLGMKAGFKPDIVQRAPDSWTGLSRWRRRSGTGRGMWRAERTWVAWLR